MKSYITNSLVSLIVDGVTSFLQLMDVQNVCKHTHFSPNKSYRKFDCFVQDGGIVIYSEGFVHIFNFSVC